MLEHHYDADQALSAEELDAVYNPHGDGEHPVFTRQKWRVAVSNEETSMGYWEYVEDMLSSVSFDELDEVQERTALVEIRPVPVLSSEHLSVETLKWFEGNTGDYSQGIDFTPFASGYFVRLCSPLHDQTEPVFAAFPDLEFIRMWMAKHTSRTSWVQFDCDAPVIDGLPTYRH